jgi:hypothetical protein
MSIYSVTEKATEDFIITVINSTLISYYVDTFINNTQTFQINDARQLPIIIPTPEIKLKCSEIVKNAICCKLNGDDIGELDRIQQTVDVLLTTLYNL